MREGVEKVIYVVMMGVRAQVRDEIRDGRYEMRDGIFDHQPISLLFLKNRFVRWQDIIFQELV